MLRWGIVLSCLVVWALIASPGELDASFQPQLPTNYHVTAVYEQQDGNLLVGGYMSPAPPRRQNSYGFLVRLRPDGTLDRKFKVNWGAKSVVGALYQIQERPDGNIGVLGWFSQFDIGTCLVRPCLGRAALFAARTFPKMKPGWPGSCRTEV